MVLYPSWFGFGADNGIRTRVGRVGACGDGFPESFGSLRLLSCCPGPAGRYRLGGIVGCLGCFFKFFLGFGWGGVLGKVVKDGLAFWFGGV